MTEYRKEKPKSKVTFWIVALIVVLLGIIAWNLLAFLQEGDEVATKQEAAPVQVAEVRAGQVEVILEQSADVLPNSSVMVVPKIRGQRILEIKVERGDQVKAGQLLARLDTETYQAKRAEVVAARAAAEAKLKVLDKDLKRLSRLEANGSASQQQLDHTLAEQRAAEALRDQAQAQLNSLDIMLADHQIRAPINGVVARRMVDAGSLSDDKSPMFLISDESRLKVLTTVSERNYPLAQVGLKAEVRVDAYPHEKFEGRVEVVSPVIDRATRSAEMEIHLDNADRRLRSGMFARVRVLMGQRPAVLVPRSAVQRMPGTGTRYAFLAEQGRAKLVNVELGESYGEQQEITKGLKPGQTVVVRGAGRLNDGMELAVAPAGEAAR